MKVLSSDELALLESIERRISELERELAEARNSWAKAVRVVTIAAVARTRGISRQALNERVKAAESSWERHQA